MTQNDDEVFAVLLFFRCEGTTENWRAFHDLEKAISNLDRGDALGFVITGHDWIPAGVGRNIFEGARLSAVVSDVGSRDLIVVLAQSFAGTHVSPHEHETVGILVWQRSQQHGIDNAEHSRVSADAERNRQHCDSSEALALRQHPNAITKVSQKSLHLLVSSLWFLCPLSLIP